jgi:cell division protein FtsQ
MSRLALMKLRPADALQTPDVEDGAGRRRAGAWTGAVLLFGAAVAGASWIGGSLVDARARIAQAFDSAAAGAGFSVAQITVENAAGVREAEIRAAALPPGRTSMFAVAPAEAKARIERLDWVAEAEVRRLWPDTLHVVVERRQAVALWQVGGRALLIGEDGMQAPPESPAAVARLPLIVGPGAGPAAPALIAALEPHADLRSQIAAAIRVEDRRWDIKLTSGAVVALPDAPAREAVARLAAVERQWRISQRPLARVDLRGGAYVAVTPRHVLAGGPSALAGA